MTQFFPRKTRDPGQIPYRYEHTESFRMNHRRGTSRGSVAHHYGGSGVALLISMLWLGAATGEPSTIIRSCFDPSCEPWLDSDGNRIEAHAAGMLQAQDGRWYWYGESKKTNNLSTHGVNLYSAEGLAGPWKFEGQVLAQSQINISFPGPYVIERPKVLYNAPTRKVGKMVKLCPKARRARKQGAGWMRRLTRR